MVDVDQEAIVSVDDGARLLSDGDETLPPQVQPEVSQDQEQDPQEELSGCWAGPLCHPKKFLHRMIALALMSLIGLGSYFCYDNPGALQKQIKDAMQINTSDFSYLYMWYSWPSSVVPVFGGYLMDRFLGIRLGTVIFASIIILGQLLFGIGGLIQSFDLMQLGRFVFGIGGESLAVAQNTYAVNWFKGKELKMAFGFQLSISRVGSAINFMVIGPLYNLVREDKEAEAHIILGRTLLIACSTCLLSFICAVILGFMDKRAGRILKKDTATSDVKFSDIFTFPLSFWLLSIVCFAYYIAIYLFVSLSQMFFIKKFDFTSKGANNITGLVYLISVVASPLFGILIDKTGRDMAYVLTAIVVTIASHVCLAFTFLNPYVPIFAIGLAYSILANSLWSLVPELIPENKLGTAYGMY